MTGQEEYFTEAFEKYNTKMADLASMMLTTPGESASAVGSAPYCLFLVSVESYFGVMHGIIYSEDL